MGKNKSNKQSYEKKIKRSSYTGRIANDKEVILVDEAEEYLKKLGYKVIRPNQISTIMTLTLTFLMIGFYSLTGNLV